MFKPPECIQVHRVHNVGRITRYDFSITGATADEAAPLLVSAILEGFKLFIDDHRRDDSEAGLIFKRLGGVLQRMNGGHGYSSKWTVVSEEDAIVEAAATILATKWGPPNGSGHFEIPNDQLLG